LNIEKIIKINSERNTKKPYNPITGEGCEGERVRLEIKDAPYPVLFLPVEMMSRTVCKELSKYKSIEKLYNANGDEYSEIERDKFWVSFCELRSKYDYEFYAVSYQTILDKETSQEIPFKLNRAQRRILAKLERMRKAGMTISIIILKARQMGGSTIIQMYMNWIQMVHRTRWNSAIAAHIKDAAITVRSMYDLSIGGMPKFDGRYMSIKDFSKSANIKYVPQRGCRITVGTAEEPDSVRSQDLKMFHASEIGLYPDTEKKRTKDLIASITSSIPNVPYTLIAYESTAKGVGDFFHTEWLRAVNNESSFDPIFNPWYVLDIYRVEFDGYYHDHKGKDRIKGSTIDFIKSMNQYEVNLFNSTDCTLEGLNWRRMKRKGYMSEDSFMEEFPSTADEAFQTTGKPVYDANHIEKMRANCEPPVTLAVIKSDASPSEAVIMPKKRKDVMQGLEIIELGQLNEQDPKTKQKLEENKIKIWGYPSYEKIAHRYLVVYDPSKGRSSGADNGVIAVFDRYWKMYGGVMELVAEMVVRDDKDIAAWISVQIASLYNDALLVIESNTYETADRHEDTELILDTIGYYYSNLYSRTDADKIKDNVPLIYGYHMNRKTKPMCVSNYTAYLREEAYIERCSEALDEARLYEKKQDGTLGAVEGHKDDRLMTRMIGCQVDKEMPLPYEIKPVEKKNMAHAKNESSF